MLETKIPRVLRTEFDYVSLYHHFVRRTAITVIQPLHNSTLSLEGSLMFSHVRSPLYSKKGR